MRPSGGYNLLATNQCLFHCRLGIGSGAGVCQQIRRLDQTFLTDRHVQMMLERIVSELERISDVCACYVNPPVRFQL